MRQVAGEPPLGEDFREHGEVDRLAAQMALTEQAPWPRVVAHEIVPREPVVVEPVGPMHDVAEEGELEVGRPRPGSRPVRCGHRPSRDRALRQRGRRKRGRA